VEALPWKLSGCDGLRVGRHRRPGKRIALGDGDGLGGARERLGLDRLVLDGLDLDRLVLG